MEEQVFSAWHGASQSSCTACRPLKKPSTVSLDAAAWAGGRQGLQALLTWGKPALSGVQGFLQCPAQLSISQQSWEELNFKGQQLSPHTSRKKQTCDLLFSFQVLLPFSLRAQCRPSGSV